jgi:hypothetical protein
MVFPHKVYLYETNTITIVTGAGAIVIDKKTGKIIRIVWEKDPRYANIKQNIAIINSGASVVEATASMKGHETIMKEAVNMMVKAEEALKDEVAKPGVQVKK